MPCNCDYLDSTNLEISISRVACLLDELDGKPINRHHWHGYHPKVYNKVTKELGDRLVADLCLRLSKTDVSKCSLEMQIWWRDHQAQDKLRSES